MRVVVTGGAGFIGSHLSRRLLDEGYSVAVIDDLSTGFESNIPAGADFIRGSITDGDLVAGVVKGANVVLHHAAARAVGQSVESPIKTDRINTAGTLNVLVAARDAGVHRVVLASSSSVYGGDAPLPTREDSSLRPKSPYAVSKLAGEEYARVFWELYALETVRLRYFNVFGPGQRPDSPYAAVIPLFAQAAKTKAPPDIHGDGLQTRDFTYIDDVVDVNLRAMTSPTEVVAGEVYNVARGRSTSVLDVWRHLASLAGCPFEPRFTDPRPGDVRHSRANVEKARDQLGFAARVSLGAGLDAYWRWVTPE